MESTGLNPLEKLIHFEWLPIWVYPEWALKTHQSNLYDLWMSDIDLYLDWEKLTGVKEVSSLYRIAGCSKSKPDGKSCRMIDS